MSLHKINTLKIYNSLSKKKEVFKPINKDFVGMYVCGPTVYSNVHLGNIRTFVSFDLVFRYLKHLGYNVRYVRNITDVGHLENESDTGEDRISKKARIEKIEPMEVVQRYTVYFQEILRKFNNLSPSIEPTATGHIVEQLEIIRELLKKRMAYIVNGSVYFDVSKYNRTDNYGILSKIDIKNSIQNTRTLEKQSEKKNPQDFALWKKASPEHIMRWSSPWSEGFPGWHLECTAMSIKYLGEQFDIHGGGIDLKFPHHECEIAQANSINQKKPVNYWMHTNMLTLNGQKMAKSTGNNILPSEIFSGNNTILKKPFTPSVIRFFMLQAHYRSNLDFSANALEASEKGYQKLIQSSKMLKTLNESSKSSLEIEKWVSVCYKAMNDDFNSPILIAQLFEGVKYINLINEGKETLSRTDLDKFKFAFNTFLFDILGLVHDENENNSEKLKGTIELLIQLRKEARNSKNWKLSDEIRDKLSLIGIQLEDGKEDTTFSIN